MTCAKLLRRDGEGHCEYLVDEARDAREETYWCVLRLGQRVSLNIGVFAAPSLSESGGTHLGIASTYLAGLKPGDRLPLAVRPSNAAFHLPGDPSVPLVMLCAGSGLAPFSQMFGWRSPSLLSFCLFSVVLPRYSSYPESKQTEDFSITIPGTKRQNYELGRELVTEGVVGGGVSFAQR